MIHIFKKILNKIIFLTLNLFGFKGYSSHLLYNALKNDILNKGIPITKKIWAYKRGFLGFRAQVFEINNENYLKYMPDFDYFKMHPINGKYGKWIDDKLTMKYILAPFDEFLPKYYFQIEAEKIFKMMNCPDYIDGTIDGIINLLYKNKDLALKPLSSSLGMGFHRLTLENNVFYINNKESRINEIITLIEKARGFIVTEYIFAHKMIRQIYKEVPNTLRILIVKNKNEEPKIIGSFMRFGTKKSGIYETMRAGTIFAGVNFENGNTYDPKRLINNKIESLSLHPDTGQELKITLPNWDLIIDKIYKISEYIPQISFVGYDIIITDYGFKIIETNSLSALTFLPYYYPFFREEYSRRFFLEKFNENPKKYKKILHILNNWDKK